MNVKNLLLGIGIFVVFALAFHQGMETFYPTPQYDKYCTSHPGPVKAPSIYSDCPAVPDIDHKAQQCYDSKADFVYEYDSNGCATGGYCDGCRLGYERDLDIHSNHVFILAVIIGIVVFIGGMFLLSTEPVGSALMGSGIFAVFYGVVANWRNFSNTWKFLILFVLLIVLIWIALRFNSKKKFSFRWKRK